jgi:Patatin-like phospholipase
MVCPLRLHRRDLRAAFTIGRGLAIFAPPLDGDLYAFANDIDWMYWNNKGTIQVTVRRIVCVGSDGPPSETVFPNGAFNFQTVQAEERQLIDTARRRFVPNQTLSRGPAALCLSGGGIRSAIFSLGCIQALDQKNLLSRFDYLSTVSGGGYIGSWLSGLIASMTRGSHSRFDQPLLNQPKAIQALQFLRENSSYLTPRKGIFSDDTWSIVAIYLRNLALNWAIILPLLAAALTFPRLIFVSSSILSGRFLIVCTIVLAVLALLYPTFVPGAPDVPQADNKTSRRGRWLARIMEPTWFILLRATPLLLMVLCLTLWLFSEAQHWGSPAPFLSEQIRSVLTDILIWGFALPSGVILLAGSIVSLVSKGTIPVPVNSCLLLITRCASSH